MRAKLFLLALLAAACADRPGGGSGRPSAPPPPPPSAAKSLDVIGAIDSARQAALIEERLYDDMHVQRWLADSLERVHKDSLERRMERITKGSEPR